MRPSARSSATRATACCSSDRPSKPTTTLPSCWPRVGADEHFLVRLEAQPSTLVQRIIAREPEAWSGLAHLIEHTQELAATMPALNGVGLVLNTEGQRPEAVAQRIRAARPDELGTAGPARP